MLAPSKKLECTFFGKRNKKIFEYAGLSLDFIFQIISNIRKKLNRHILLGKL